MGECFEVYSWEYFPYIPRIFCWNILRIYSEYTENIFTTLLQFYEIIWKEYFFIPSTFFQYSSNILNIFWRIFSVYSKYILLEYSENKLRIYRQYSYNIPRNWWRYLKGIFFYSFNILSIFFQIFFEYT